MAMLSVPSLRATAASAPPAAAHEANGLSQLAPPPPGTATTASDPSRFIPEAEPPPALPWLIAAAATIAFVLATTWAFRERARAKMVSEELSRIRMHRTASLRVTTSIDEPKKEW